MQEYIDAINMDVIITEVGIFVAGFAAVLGIWLERDKTKPPRYAWWLSLLILLATFVGMFQTLADAKEGEEIKADMARMLATLDKIAQNSDVEIPELNEFVKSEVSAQARANPDIVKKVAQRVSDEGGDPAEMLGTYLPSSEVEGVARKGGLNTKKSKMTLANNAGEGGDKAAGEKPKRRKLEFGGGKTKPREEPEKRDGDAPARPKFGGGDKDDKDDKKSDKDDKDDKKSDKDKDDKKDDKDDKKSDKDKDDKKDDGKPKLGAPAASPGGRPLPGGAKPPAVQPPKGKLGGK